MPSITTDLDGQKKLAGPLLAAFAAAGFKAVHWCQDWIGEPVFYSQEFATQTRQLADHFGLRIADVHGYGGTAATGITCSGELYAAMNINRAEFAARVGASVVVVHVPPLRCNPQEGIKHSLVFLEAIRPAFERLGIKAAVENLPWEEHTDRLFETLLGHFPPDFLGFCYDSGHAVISSQAHLLSRHVSRLLSTHLHDNDGSADQHRLPGQGKADWPAIARTLNGSHYRGTINLELKLPAERNLLDFCQEAYAVLKDKDLVD